MVAAPSSSLLTQASPATPTLETKASLPRYTYYGITALEEKICADLELFLAYFGRKCSFRHVRAIILGGTYGRGEAGFTLVDEQNYYLSEPYLIYIFVEKIGFLKRQAINQKLLDVAAVLKGQLLAPLKLTQVLPIEALWDIPRRVKWHELKWDSQVLWGERSVLRYLPGPKEKPFSPQMGLPELAEQGMALLSNKRRYLLRKRWRRPQDKIDFYRAIYQTLIACGTCYLILKGEYTLTGLGKLKKLQVLEEKDAFLKEFQFSKQYWNALQCLFRLEAVPTASWVEDLLAKTLAIYERVYFMAYASYTTRSAWQCVTDAKLFVKMSRETPIALFPRAKAISRKHWRHVGLNFICMGGAGLWGKWKYYHPSYRVYAAILGVLLETHAEKGLLVRLADEALGLKWGLRMQRSFTSRSVMLLRLWRTINV